MKKRKLIVVFLLLAVMIGSPLLVDTTVAKTTKNKELEYEITFNYHKDIVYQGYVTTTVTIPLDQGKADSERQRKALARQAALDTLRDKCLTILSQAKKDFQVVGYEEAQKISMAIGLETVKIEYKNNKLVLEGKMYFM